MSVETEPKPKTKNAPVTYRTWTIGMAREIRWPDVCCCCLKPFTAAEREANLMTMVVKMPDGQPLAYPIPTCELCQRHWGISHRAQSWTFRIFSLAAVGVFGIGSQAGRNSIMASAILTAIFGALIVGALLLVQVLLKPPKLPPGHVTDVEGPLSVDAVGGSTKFVFRNNEYLAMFEELNGLNAEEAKPAEPA